ncbi:hypothetical protein [Stenotrophomonas sp. PD6]|uniref:hypothetical protein n=1 Tax=Stenotrophomonas sp. PD6 TaxID=3368612 RepID=UPI003B9EA93C
MDAKACRCHVLLLSLLIAALDCSANEVQKITLAAKAADSDVVVIGVVGEVSRCARIEAGECRDSAVTAKVHVQEVLKGPVPAEIRFRCEEAAPEFSPAACAPETARLLFLRADGNGVFHAVNGPYGAYDLSLPAGQSALMQFRTRLDGRAEQQGFK